MMYQVSWSNNASQVKVTCLTKSNESQATEVECKQRGPAPTKRYSAAACLSYLNYLAAIGRQPRLRLIVINSVLFEYFEDQARQNVIDLLPTFGLSSSDTALYPREQN